MKPLRVLVVGDSEDDCLRVLAHLRREGFDVTSQRVETADAMREALAAREWDVILSDYQLPRFNAPAALRLLQASRWDLPFIVLSGTIGEETAVRALKAGAHDFMPKDNLARLVPAIERERRDATDRRKRAEAERVLRMSETRYRDLVEGIPVGVYRTAPDGALLDANSTFLDMLGLPAEEATGCNVIQFYADPAERDRWCEAVGAGAVIVASEVEVRRDGMRLWVRDTGRAVRGPDGKVRCYEGVLEDITALRAAQEAGRRREARFRALIEYSSDLVSVLDAEGTLLFQTTSLQRILGYEPGENLGQNMFTFIHPDDQLEIRTVVARGLADPQFVGRAIYRFRHKDGGWRHLESVGRNLLDEPSVRGIVINSRDVSDRVQTEAELRIRTRELGERVKELRCLYGITTVLAQAGTDLDCQAIVERIPAGWQFPELACARLVIEGRESRTPDYQETPWRQHGPITVDGNPIGTVEVCYRERPAGAAAVFLDEERVLLETIADQIAMSVRRRRAEDALSDREARFRGLIENSSDLIGIITPEGRTVYASPSYRRVLGHQPEEILALDQFALIHPDDEARVRDVFAELIRAGPGSTRQVEFRMRHKDGSWRHLESSGRNLVHDPNIGGAVINTRDLTDRVQLEEQFRQAQKMEAVGRLAGGVAHDFNNLITVIDGNAAFLLEELSDADPRRAEVEEIKKAGERAAALTRQLLTFSRRQVLQPRVLDVNTVVSEMDKMLRRLIGEDIEFTTVLAPGLTPVMADPGQVEQVLLNLVVNARDAMPAGGKLTIETKNVELDMGYCAAFEDLAPGRFALVAVSDTGQGISSEMRAHLFEPFFTTKKTGTGLGLATVYGIVKQSRGHIAVYSEVNQGTTFKVYLPANQAAAAAPGTLVPVTTPTRATETVLLVEDSPGVRAVAARVLRDAGYTVLEVESGPAAVEFVERYGGPIDVLVTDVVMPHMSGRELADQLALRLPGLRVLYMSGYTDDSILRHGVLAQGVHFLEKPFSSEALLRKLRQVLAPPATV